MTETGLRRLFLFGTLGFLIILGAMTLDSLSKITAARTPPLTPDVVAGKRLWQARNCNDCHTILGIGAYFAPDMTKAATRRDPAWLARFLHAPRTTKPGTTMPDVALTEVEAGQLVAFLDWVSRIDTNGWPPAPRLVGGGGNAGAMLFEQKACSTCHSTSGPVADLPGPDLSHVGGRLDAATIERWIAEPDAMKPDTIMPRAELTVAERDALVQFLAGLR